MYDETEKPGNLLETTDCLEAVGVFKGWKNFFFLVIFLCILLLQVCFWLVDLGIAKPDGSDAGAITKAGMDQKQPKAKALKPAEPNQPVIAEPNKPAEPNQPAEPNKPIDAAPNEPAKGETAKPPVAKEEKAGSRFDFIKTRYITKLVCFLNFVLIPALILYCLTLIFTLKLSLVGRLGGITHISRAFFISLILLVIAMPWQEVFGSIFCGMIFTPEELLTRSEAFSPDKFFKTILYYLRFAGYGVLGLLLLIFAQYRSVQWSKTILKRLEII